MLDKKTVFTVLICIVLYLEIAL